MVIEKNEGKGEGRKDDISVEGPFGWKLRANGREVSVFVALAVATGALLWAIRDHDLRAVATLERAVEDRRKQLDLLSTQQADLQESMSAMIYVLSLSQDERTKLKLEMPPSLRSRLLTSERNR